MKTFLSIYFTIFSQILLNSQTILPPENGPSNISWDGQKITMFYHGDVILEGTLENTDALEYYDVLEDKDGDAASQVIQWVSRKEPLKITGTIFGSAESFPCEAERKEDAPLMVRHSVGLSHSLLNRAVYDRRWDWLLSADFPSEIVIEPQEVNEDGISYRFELTGWSLIMRFRPLFYQKHKGLEYFEPWNYEIWKGSVAGWCSWFAFYNKVTEQDIHKTADILADELVPYGLEYLQVDDGYQQVPIGEPERWLVANEKFPGGMESLAKYIKDRGMKPGVWTNVSFVNRDFVMQNQQYFVKDEEGGLAYGNWVGFVMDGSNNETIEQLITPVYAGFKETGWEYFKVDALRHLRYEGYNSHAEYFKEKGLDRKVVFRNTVEAIRDAISKEHFMMGCWGIRPELIGIIDACRIGDDGFGYGGLAEYNSFNNVVWRNDPDHIELTPEDAYKSCMTTSLTGSLYMLTDKPEIYRTELAEAAKRTLPVLFTRPGQVYEVDPSRIVWIDKANTEVSGGGPRPFDADQREYCHLYLQEINMPYENWIVLGRTEEKTIQDYSLSLEDLGLSLEEEYLAFEFWTKEFLGVFKEEIILPSIDTTYHCQAICIREKLYHPQVMATNRHISCGAVELKELYWGKGVLSGKSELVANEIYKIYIHEPKGYTFSSFVCEGAEYHGDRKKGSIRVVSMKASKHEVVQWEAFYR